MLDQALLRSLLRYDSVTGKLFWSARRFGVKLGREAGRARRDGYRDVKILGNLYLSHRLAWLYVHGRWPEKFIDHINGNRADNRIENLRECSNSQNLANRPAQMNNKCGLKGVHKVKWSSGEIRWKAQIFITRDKAPKEVIYLGCYKSKSEAHAVYSAKAEELFGEFARANAVGWSPKEPTPIAPRA